jgi:hypothetical protein
MQFVAVRRNLALRRDDDNSPGAKVRRNKGKLAAPVFAVIVRKVV